MINSIKELQKLVEMCQKTGVESMKIGNIEFKLGTPPESTTPKKAQSSPRHLPNSANDPFSMELAAIKNNVNVIEDKNEEIKELTEEELMFYSVTTEN